MKTVEELEKLAIYRIVEELKDGTTMTSMRMLTILNDVRVSEKLQPKKQCATNRQKFVDLVRKVLREQLGERIDYSSGWGEGRKPTQFYITNYESAKAAVTEYFSKTAEKKRKSNNGQKKEAISKILVILKKIEEAPDYMIKLDLLKELIDTKTPVNTTMRNWETMLKKEGIILTFKAERGLYKFEEKNVTDVKTKLEELYKGMSEEKPVRTRVPKVSIPKEEKELTEDEERVVYLLAQTVNKKQVPYSEIWKALKKQGISAGFDFNNLIRRAGLKKWFTASKKSVPGGAETCLEFTGDIQAVASLMGQETEKIYLIRSSLDETQMKTYMKSNNFKLLNAKPGDNFYELRCSDHESKARIAMLAMSFRGYDSFIYEDDAQEIEELKDSILKAYLNGVEED